MSAITYQDWSGGLDRRLDISVQEASRLWVLRNAHITLGKRIKKRPALSRVASGLTGSHGLKSISGRLKVFTDRGVSFTPPSQVDAITLDIPTWSSVGASLAQIHHGTVFTGYPYVVAQYSDGSVGHHYVDRDPTVVTMTIASPGVITWTGHGLKAGREVVLSTDGALPTGFTEGVVYYVVSPATDTFQLSATSGGAAINTSGAQSGTHTAIARTTIPDTNNPRSVSVTTAASRIYAINGETVRYCAAGDPRDWTTSSDAGFLSASLQQNTKSGCTAVGTFQDALVVFFDESAQIWDVAVDPSANSLRKRIQGVGCKAPLSQAGFANDLAFLSPYGVRSMTVAQNTDRIDDTDIGSPIDSLVSADVEASAAVTNPAQTFGLWIHEFGQYWVVLDMGGYSKAWVYMFSRSSKVACWSEYKFPYRITDIATLGGKVYARTADDLFEVSPSVYTDAGMLIDVEAQMAFQDAKTPGITKQFYGADYVVKGSPSVSFKYDPRSTDKETAPQVIPGDTRPGDMLPVEVVAPAVAAVFRHSLDEAFELNAATFYFYPLGPV